MILCSKSGTVKRISVRPSAFNFKSMPSAFARVVETILKMVARGLDATLEGKAQYRLKSM